jgi:hypothetical protein
VGSGWKENKKGGGGKVRRGWRENDKGGERKWKGR